MNKYVIVQTDGACRGNPGPAATGIVILDGTSSQTIAEFGSKLGHATNNEAEYQALLEAVKWLLERKALLAHDVQIHFYLDSELVVKQLTGVFRINGLRLRELAGEVQTGLSQLPGKYAFQHIPRSQNARADRLANKTLDT